MTGSAAYADWIAVDWGAAELRAWAMRADGPRAAAAGPAPAQPGPAAAEEALLQLLEPWLGAAPCEILACGEIGGPEGWMTVPCPAVPARPLAAAPVAAPTQDGRLDLRLVPGLQQSAPADIMRGPETRIAGLLARLPGWDGILCLPGLHTVWAEVSAGEVVSFRTYMTGELHAALAGHTVLRHAVGEGWDEAAFVEAVSEAMSRPEALAGRLFGLRAESLLAGLDGGAAGARLWGLLLGIELAAARPYWLGRDVIVIAPEAAGARYRPALAAQGAEPALAEADATILAGLAAARAR